MIIRKCNNCGEVIHEDQPYYSIRDISYTIPGSNFTRLVREFGEQNYNESLQNESWTSWPDLDFCPPCWQVKGLDDFLPELEDEEEGEDNDNDSEE